MIRCQGRTERDIEMKAHTLSLTPQTVMETQAGVAKQALTTVV